LYLFSIVLATRKGEEAIGKQEEEALTQRKSTVYENLLRLTP